MGLFGTLLSFAAGYAAGMKLGDKPVRIARTAREEVRTRTSSIAGAAGALRSGTTRGTTVDVRSVREVMTPSPTTVTPDAKLVEAAGLMDRESIGDVLVVDTGGRLRGILTDRDIAVGAVAKGRDASTAKVEEIMSPTVETISADSTVQQAIELMRRYDVRRLPVVQDGRPIGIVSLGDVSMSRQAQPLLADISASPPNN
jgi:CBS domain-containing protein